MLKKYSKRSVILAIAIAIVAAGGGAKAGAEMMEGDHLVIFAPSIAAVVPGHHFDLTSKFDLNNDGVSDGYKSGLQFYTLYGAALDYYYHFTANIAIGADVCFLAGKATQNMTFNQINLSGG